ncbi:hypothetical protein [Arcticibacter tournemirensis]
MEKIIKAGFLVSYDFNMLRISLPIIYPHLSQIYLCIDKERLTWSGEQFYISDEFWEWLSIFDSQNKIVIYEDQFYLPNLSPLELDTRERSMLASQMGECDWCIQIDSDEYFLDFPQFISKLRQLDTSSPLTVYCRVAPLFKKTRNGFLLIDSEEYLPFATNLLKYTSARTNEACTSIFWNDIVIHQSWARSAEEIKQKLNNWSHKDDFNVESYYNLWLSIDEDNYRYLSDFHPLDGVSWSKLRLLENWDICDMINQKEWFYQAYQAYAKDNKMVADKKKPFWRFFKKEV